MNTLFQKLRTMMFGFGMAGQTKMSAQRIAKLFGGPQDGLMLKVNEVLGLITIRHAAEEDGDPQNIVEDNYILVPDWCQDPMCEYLHYEYEMSEDA